jgi:hypoxanthine phosphoribosyltransferase
MLGASERARGAVATPSRRCDTVVTVPSPRESPNAAPHPPQPGAAGVQVAGGEVVLDAAQIAGRVAGLAAEIDAAYPALAQPLVLVCVLKGSVFFTVDLARALRIPVVMDFIAVRSYQGTRSGGTVELVKDIGMPLQGRDVLLVEDIIDTGLTTAFLLDHVGHHRPRSLRLVALLDKRAQRRREVRVDFTGFRIPDRFVVGYGLDVDERWRNLPDVRTLEGR